MRAHDSRRLFSRHTSIGWLVLLSGMASANLAWAATCRVTISGTPGGDGSGWTGEATDLQTALASSTCSEVWVAAGIYKPTNTATRTISFPVKSGVAVYGGFAGGETLLSQRDPRTNPTILSGDIDNNDLGSNGINADAGQIVGNNSYHVVFIDGTSPAGPVTSNTVLDGFVITGGNATGVSDDYGGGLFCDGTYGTHECSPTLRNLHFSGNHADSGGGALCNDGSFDISASSSPTLTNITFSGNSAFYGGAMISVGYQGTSSPVLNNVTFSGNTANNGGALYNAGFDGNSTLTLNNVTFTGNSAVNGAPFTMRQVPRS
ncbi:MAG: hypothetical protein IPP82_07390 [Xanthomonadales bacterium]|nr:hypothetical protein [Xanthomonadales bacterium]